MEVFCQSVSGTDVSSKEADQVGLEENADKARFFHILFERLRTKDTVVAISFCAENLGAGWQSPFNESQVLQVTVLVYDCELLIQGIMVLCYNAQIEKVTFSAIVGYR